MTKRSKPAEGGSLDSLTFGGVEHHTPPHSKCRDPPKNVELKEKHPECFLTEEENCRKTI